MLRRLIVFMVGRLPPIDFDAIDAHLLEVARATSGDAEPRQRPGQPPS